MEQQILDEIYNQLGRFVVFPTEHSRVIVTIYIAHTHLANEGYTSPRLYITSATKGCGKTTLKNIIKALVPNPCTSVNPSGPSLFTMIELMHPTLLIDETDRLWSKKDTGEIISIIDAGFMKGETVPRVSFDTKGTRKIDQFATFGPMVLVGIDKNNTPDTILDRSIEIRLKRIYGAEKIEAFRPRKHANGLQELQTRIAAFGDSIRERVKEFEPEFPLGIDGRDADRWEPLFIVADVTDVTHGTGVSGWGRRVREAALALLQDENEDEPEDYGELVLTHIHDIMSCLDKIQISELVDRLDRIPEAPWSTYEYGRPLSTRGLGRLLQRHRIKAKMIRFPDEQSRGYYKSQFEDAWNRYRTPEMIVPSVLSVSTVPDRVDPMDVSEVKLAVPTLNLSVGSTRSRSDDTWDSWIAEANTGRAQ